MTALIHRAMPLCATLGFRAEKYTVEEVVLAAVWAPGLFTTGGILHGGKTQMVLRSRS
jgi:acyl-coenzyme A thioesterase PaaI-like protein